METKQKDSIQKIASEYVKAHEYADENNDPCFSWINHLDGRLLQLIQPDYRDGLSLLRYAIESESKYLADDIMSMVYTRLNRIKEKLKQRSKKNGNRTKRFYPKDSK